MQARITFIVAVIVAFAAIAHLQHSGKSADAGIMPIAPVFGWKPVLTEVAPVPSAQYRYWGFGQSKAPALRVTVTAVLPVDIAVTSAKYADLVQSGAWNTYTGECTAVNVLSTAVVCELPASAAAPIVVVHDRRDNSAGAQFSAAIVAAIGAKQPLADVTARNDVRVVAEHWECVEHCQQ